LCLRIETYKNYLIKQIKKQIGGFADKTAKKQENSRLNMVENGGSLNLILEN
jgi:hypothetical protein